LKLRLNILTPLRLELATSTTNAGISTSSFLQVGYSQSHANEFYGASATIRGVFSPGPLIGTNKGPYGPTGPYQAAVKLLDGKAQYFSFAINLACPCVCFAKNANAPPTAFVPVVTQQSAPAVRQNNPPLTWNNNLRSTAQEIADKCRIYPSTEDRRLEHLFSTGAVVAVPESSLGDIIGDRTRKMSKFLGFNQAAFLSLARTGNDAWLAEKQFYNCTTNQCVNGPCNHFLQAASFLSETVGCAITTCNTGSPFGTLFGPTWYHHVCTYNGASGTVRTRPYASVCPS